MVKDSSSESLNKQLIIGGAPKSGTTALYYYLHQHPDLFLPEKKELHFYSNKSIVRSVSGPGDKYIAKEIPNSWVEYLKYFDRVNEKQIPVDISPSYLYHFDSANEIKKRVLNPRVVFLLRNPADKAFSQYLHLKMAGRENLSFVDALDQEEARAAAGYSDMWLYAHSGFYMKAIKYWIETLGRDAVEIFLYEDFFNNPDEVLKTICNHAGVTNNISFKKVNDANRSGEPKSKFIAWLFVRPNKFTHLARRFIPAGFGRNVRKWIRDNNTGDKPLLDVDTRKKLMENFTQDIRDLEILLGRNTGWLD